MINSFISIGLNPEVYWYQSVLIWSHVDLYFKAVKVYSFRYQANNLFQYKYRFPPSFLVWQTLKYVLPILLCSFDQVKWEAWNNNDHSPLAWADLQRGWGQEVQTPNPENHKWLHVFLEILLQIPLEKSLDQLGPMTSRGGWYGPLWNILRKTIEGY